MAEKFISMCIGYYELDPCHYISSPGLRWDTVLNMTGVGLDLSSDIDMYLFVESGMRGGISYITKRYSKVNNKYTKSYDDTNPSKCITYLDVNDLDGWTMSQ